MKIKKKKKAKKCQKKRQKETRRLKTILANKLQRLYQKGKTSKLARSTRKKFINKKTATKKYKIFIKKVKIKVINKI